MRVPFVRVSLSLSALRLATRRPGPRADAGAPRGRGRRPRAAGRRPGPKAIKYQINSKFKSILNIPY